MLTVGGKVRLTIPSVLLGQARQGGGRPLYDTSDCVGTCAGDVPFLWWESPQAAIHPLKHSCIIYDRTVRKSVLGLRPDV